MHFDFTEDTYDLRDGARDFLQGECTPEYLRSVWDAFDDAGSTGRSDTLWKQLAETGLVGLTIAEKHGGLGMNEVDLVLILEEAGRVALPEPLIETTAIAAPTITEAGTDEQRNMWLPRIASGDAVATVQLGDQQLVTDAHVADILICQRGDELHLVPAERFNATPQPAMDRARRLFSVEAETGTETRMDGDADATTKAFDRAAAATAAFLSGLSQQMLDLTVAYVKERTQFGVPVGSFQAVKHKLAETLLLTETAKAPIWYAAYAIAHDLPDRSSAVSVAKAYANQAAAKANFEALQCHGGIGFTWEHDLHLWMKRGEALEQSFGSARFHRQRLEEHVLAGDVSTSDVTN